MLVATGVLFVPACFLFLAACVRALAPTEELAAPRWRNYCLKAAISLTGFAILTNLIFFISWFHNGGSPHGLHPSPGIWTKVCPTHDWLPVASIVVAALGKGRGRWLAAGSALAVILAAYALFMLEME